MNTPEIKQNHSLNISGDDGERGTAIVIALFVLALIGVFVALALSRTASEAAAVGNETSEARTLYAAQGGLEMMTRNFNKVFEARLNPLASDIALVENGDIIPGLSTALGGEYDFNQELLCVRGISPDCAVRTTAAESTVVLTDTSYSGLIAIRDTWRLKSTATGQDGTEIELNRNILNNRIPIFQFGIFYDDDLELFRPPLFSFGGRVHSNRHFFISPGTDGVYFDSRVTASGHIITQSWRNGFTGDSANARTFIKDASGEDQQLFPTEGSVLNGTPNIFVSNPDMPSSRINPDFEDDTEKFDGNLQKEVPVLRLPLKVGANIDLVEMIKRGKKIAGAEGGDLAWNGTAVVPVGTPVPPNPSTADNDIMQTERFANKTGIRISLSDSKARLPGCALGVLENPITGPCGVRLDGHYNGQGNGPVAVPAPLPVPLPSPNPYSRGYLPKPMTDGYQATRVNGERLFMGREVWIKIETVRTDEATGEILTEDITEDILSLGVTEEAPSGMNISGASCTRADLNNGTFSSPSSNLTATAPQTPMTCVDSRSVIKLQRFAIPGASIPTSSPTSYLTYNGSGYNYVRRFTNADSAKISNGCPTTGPSTCIASNADPTITLNERFGHLKLSGAEAVVPFPIEMFDSREGEYYDDAARYTANRVTRNGVMSLVDIDVANLRRFMRGDFNGRFPTDTPFALEKGSGLIASWNPSVVSDIPQKEGWVFYVSDRRGDGDFDGEYDMEDIYSNSPGNTGGLDLGEDINRSGGLDAKYINPAFSNNSCVGFTTTCEATRYAEDWVPDVAAVTDHKYFRRGVRLINGTTIPGILDRDTPANTRGFTVASENGIYVKGNYNATHVTSIPASGNTPFNNYRPIDDPVHVPAAIVADGVTILSNNWKDAESFVSPYNKSGTYRQATDTTIRFAMISGDTIASRETTPHQGGISPRLNGGVHNFKRFLERWTGDNLSYSGSLINLFNSRNNNGSFKCCNTVYDPPRRNWVFDSTFLDPGRLPPGTPFFQYVQTTGFQRSTD